jgi:hypothetical protein
MNRTIKEDEKRSHAGGMASIEWQALSLRQPRPPPAAPRPLCRRLQLRSQAQDPQRPHTIRSHLQSLAQRATSIYLRSDPSNSGTKQLGSGPIKPLAEVTIG